MPHSNCLTKPFLASSRPASAYERGQDLCTFVSAAASHVFHTLQRPCRNRPSKRKVNHRRFLQNQIFRSFSNIEAATRRLASSILSQKAQTTPSASHAKRLPLPHTALPSADSNFLGTAEAFMAPDPSPGWPLSLDSLTSDPDTLFEPITENIELTTNSAGPLGSSSVHCDIPPNLQVHGGAVVSVDPNICFPVAAECPSPVSATVGFVPPAHDTSMPFWDLEIW